MKKEKLSKRGNKFLKEVKIKNVKPSKKDFYLTVYNDISHSLTPTDIAKKYNVSKQRVNYYIKYLKQNRYITKQGYGVWETTEKEVKIEPIHTSKTPHETRSHAFTFKLHITKTSNWKNREKFLTRNNINFKRLGIYGKVHRIIFRNFKIWLCNKSIIVFFPRWKYYFTESAKTGHNYAVYDFIQLIIGLENLLKINFKINKVYKFNVSKQHHALIHNELSKQYNRERKRLRLFDDNGVFWLLIDNSDPEGRGIGLNEIDTVNAETSMHDHDDVVKPFFNQLKETKLMPQDILSMIGNVTKNQEVFAENMKSHISAIQELSKGVKELRKEVKNIKGKRIPKQKIEKNPTYIG